MSNITTYLNKIKTAIYGKEVRSSIHDALDMMNKDAKKLDADLTDRMVVAEICAEEAMQKAKEAKGGVVLWKGCAFPGTLVEFTIPEYCFHHNKTTLTLMIESYTVKVGGNAPNGNKPIFVTLILGTMSEMMGSTLGPSFEPYANEQGYATNDLYTNIHIDVDIEDLVKASVRAKKTVDSRYAIGTFAVSQESDGEVMFTSVSAIISKDLEVNEI